MTTELLVRDDKIVRIETIESDRVVDYDDIEVCVEYDDWHDEAPWETCDGWDHDTCQLGWSDHQGRKDSRGYARCGRSGNHLIEIDDADIIGKWGFTRHDGESKQVWLERVARVKRTALDQLVDWYENGWTYYTVSAHHSYYSDSCGGIDCPDYAKEVAEECRKEVACQMEADGYTVENMPEPLHPYNRIDAERARIKRNLNMS